MLCAESKPDTPRLTPESEAVWAVRVLLAAALSRALRAGLSKDDILELLRGLEERGETDA